MKTILAARGNPTGRSWAFLGFKVPSGGEQIINHQLSSLLASRPQLTGTEYSSCQLAAPTRKSWICVGSRFYRPISNDGTAPDHDAWLSRPAPPPIRKRGISKISTPVIPLDLRTPAPVLTTDSGSKTPGQATFAPWVSFSLWNLISWFFHRNRYYLLSKSRAVSGMSGEFSHRYATVASF